MAKQSPSTRRTPAARMSDPELIYRISVGRGVKVLSTLPDGSIAAAQQGNLLATTFHPELTPDVRLHTHFLHLCAPLIPR